jgi:hypothetical protein
MTDRRAIGENVCADGRLDSSDEDAELKWEPVLRG